MSAQEAEYGPPYEVGGHCDYNRALEIARSAHPARVLANTNVYRYGTFVEHDNGSVTVTMMGNRIAVFRPAGVELWSCGVRTTTTTYALNELVTGGRFYTERRVIMFRSYEGWTQPLAEGQAFPYASRP